MKTCEYCGSEVADETVSCPSCAAAFPPWVPPPVYRPLWTTPPPEPIKARLERSFSTIGKVVVLFFLANFLFGLLLTTSASRGSPLLLALVFLVIAGLILRRALR